MGMSEFELEARARLALDVALGMAAAMGDERCGTEHLLFGLVATSDTEMSNLTDLFVLDKTRVERSVATLRQQWCTPTDQPGAERPLSIRAELALYVRPLTGSALSPFDVLLGTLADPRSGASSVLRSLGVRPGEVRRLAELGAARLTSEEVERLIGTLDRRVANYNGWWGPRSDSQVARVDVESGPTVVLASSNSAELTLNGVVAGEEGFGFTLKITSTDNWLLPPRWEPGEELVPGLGARHEFSPDVVSLDLAYGDGTMLSNREPSRRFRRDCPTDGVLTLLGTRREVEETMDRRVPVQRSDSADWWVWPLPPKGIVTVAVNWPAESIHGVVDLDSSNINNSALAVRTSR